MKRHIFESIKSLRIVFILAIIPFNILAQSPKEANYDESKVPLYKLPNVLCCTDGFMVQDKRDWGKKRKPEILHLLSEQEYGITPTTKLAVSYQLLSNNPKALGGIATTRQVRMRFSGNGMTHDAYLLLVIPNKTKGKLPVFVGLNFMGNHSTMKNTDILYSPWFGLIEKKDDPAWKRACQANRWPFEMIVKRGYAVATMYYGDIYPDEPGFRDKSIIPLFPNYHSENELHPTDWQALGAWAWSNSRILDYLLKQKWVDKKRVAVIGHSRQGKAALWAGAQDPRFGLVISNESGCGGAALSKRTYGETINRITKTFPYWFCQNFKRYSKHEETMPFDQHELIALIAPRPVYVGSAQGDQWADPHGEYLSAYHAGAVYKLYGLKSFENTQMPALNEARQMDIAYHVRQGKHDVTDFDWKNYLDFADKKMK